ncbi:hypothetical protein N658DRAFT_498374 [Parathielavia hyrcaniae]|uniref:Uncharacterized protein n=1 Tax=Parathielavia hyrcaniae TaxID=113614 RepID=A0AAN6PWV2_9PEZI|nr:hypothetical protein N658DRAFT_498374 [Parathielavia hyrcaniae]
MRHVGARLPARCRLLPYAWASQAVTELFYSSTTKLNKDVRLSHPVATLSMVSAKSGKYNFEAPTSASRRNHSYLTSPSVACPLLKSRTLLASHLDRPSTKSAPSSTFNYTQLHSTTTKSQCPPTSLAAVNAAPSWSSATHAPTASTHSALTASKPGHLGHWALLPLGWRQQRHDCPCLQNGITSLPSHQDLDVEDRLPYPHIPA